MKRILKTFFMLVPCLLMLGLVSMRVADPQFLEMLRYKSFDAYQKAWPKPQENLPIYVVDVDDKSLAIHGQWPWPRIQMAALVDQLFDRYGIAGAAFDMVFSEPDRTSPENLSKYQTDPIIIERLATLESHDDVLAQAVSKNLIVLGETFKLDDVATAEARPMYAKARFIERQQPSEYFTAEIKRLYPQTTDVVRNLDVLEKSAKSIGHFNIMQDVDSIVRKIPAVLEYQGQYYPTLSLELLRLIQGEKQPIHLNYSMDGGLSSVRVGRFEVPVDEQGFVWPRFRHFNEARYISAADILSGEFPVHALQGAFVFIGTSAPGLFDLRSTPLDAVVPGVDLHVQLLEAMLTENTLHRPMSTDVAEQIFTIMALVLMVMLMTFFGARASLWILGSLLVFVVGFSIWMFRAQGYLVDATYPVLALVVVYVVMVAQKYMREEYKRRTIRHAFSHYLSPDLVRMLGQEEAQLTLGGEQREMTVMFTDVRDFTSLSEGLTPQQLTHLLNRYLTPMTEVVQKHQGTIDKYIGDAIMAFWNAPLFIENHATKACQAALDMFDALNKVNFALRQESLPILKIGIGINTDVVSVGNMGSDQRFDYTVMGDGVNLASRLEGLCKPYGICIIVSEAVVRASEGFLFAPIDKVAVKGKTEPVCIYALLPEGQEKMAEQIKSAYQAYQSQQWDEALMLYGVLENMEVLRTLYMERLTLLKARGVESDWDGVYHWQIK